MSQFAQRLCFDLANALTRHIKVLAHFFQRPFVAPVVESEAQTNHTLFTRVCARRSDLDPGQLTFAALNGQNITAGELSVQAADR